MKTLKMIGILVALYVAIVVLFESLLGYAQPQSDDTLVLVTRDASGEHPRVLSAIKTDRGLYVAVNHWPRAWYNRLQANPNVSVTLDEVTTAYKARLVSGGTEEYQYINSARPLSLTFRVLTGFPPRHFVSLEPAAAAPSDNMPDRQG